MNTEFASALYNADYCTQSMMYVNTDDNGHCPCCGSDDSLESLSFPYDFQNTVKDYNGNLKTILDAMISYDRNEDDYQVSHPIDMLIAMHGVSDMTSLRKFAMLSLYHPDSDMFEISKREDDPTYVVRVADFSYEMNDYPHLPNGVCITTDVTPDKDNLIRQKDVNPNIIMKAADIFITDALTRVEKMKEDLGFSLKTEMEV